MANMKAMQVKKAGGDFEMVEIPIPEPGTHQIRIKVDACGVVRKDVINNSFNETNGIVGVNQSSGNMVIQENAVAIGVGKGLILSEMELGAVCIKENDVTTDKVWREDKIIDSFNDIRGVVQVNQTSGDAIVSKNYLGYTFSNLEAP